MNLNSFNPLHYTKRNSCNGHEKEAFVGTRLCSISKYDCRVSCVGKNAVSLSSGVEMQPDSIALGSLAAEMIPNMDAFSFTDDGEYDLDWPTTGFSSIPEAIEDIRQGKVVSLFSLLRFPSLKFHKTNGVFGFKF